MKLFYTICRGTLKMLFFVLYRHKVYHLENVPKGKAIIAPNHISFLDPPMIGVSCPVETHFLAKDILFNNPIVRMIITNLNALPVSGRVNDLQTIRTICKTLENNEKVVIFPEGLRSFDGQLQDVKAGISLIAMRVNAPIVPTLIHGTFEILPRQKKFPKLWGRTSCSFGPPIYPSDYQHLDKKTAQRAISEQVKKSIEELRSQIPFPPSGPHKETLKH